MSDFKLKILSEDRMSLWPKQAWYSSPSNILGQILLQGNDNHHLGRRIHLLLKERCCFLPVVNWGVSGVTALLCQLCCQHAPGVPPGQAALGLCTLTHTGQAQSGTLERREDRAICLANFRASILMAANSSSSCHRVWWGSSPQGKKCGKNRVRNV